MQIRSQNEKSPTIQGLVKCSYFMRERAELLTNDINSSLPYTHSKTVKCCGGRVLGNICMQIDSLFGLPRQNWTRKIKEQINRTKHITPPQLLFSWWTVCNAWFSSSDIVFHKRETQSKRFALWSIKTLENNWHNLTTSFYRARMWGSERERPFQYQTANWWQSELRLMFSLTP